MMPLNATANIKPKCNAGNSVKLERSMVRDHNRGRYARYDVKIHPLLCGAQAAQPGHYFAQRVKKNDDKQCCSEYAQLEPNRAARLQHLVLVRKRPLIEREHVIPCPIDSYRRHQQERRPRKPVLRVCGGPSLSCEHWSASERVLGITAILGILLYLRCCGGHAIVFALLRCCV
jgi:hypothetical protein